MSESKPIVCATRGGEGSHAVQIAAIRQAKETGCPLVFLYVTDPSSLGSFEGGVLTAVRKELNWMGETLLRTAQRRADDAQLHSEVRIRQGNVREEISHFLKEHDAGLLLLGTPRGTTANVFGDDAVEKFAQSIMDSTGVKVGLIRPETEEAEAR